MEVLEQEDVALLYLFSQAVEDAENQRSGKTKFSDELRRRAGVGSLDCVGYRGESNWIRVSRVLLEWTLFQVVLRWVSEEVPLYSFKKMVSPRLNLLLFTLSSSGTPAFTLLKGLPTESSLMLCQDPDIIWN